MPFKVLHIGLASSAPCWYRCALPAWALENDWIGTFGALNGQLLAGNIQEVNYNNYDILVCQQPSSEDSLNFIKRQKKSGKKIVFECDDFVHGVKKIKGHRFQKAYNKKKIKFFQECMAESDAVICSTQYLSDQYKKYNPNQYVVPNGIETDRYDIERGEKEFLTIGWAGGTGHHLAVGPWLEAVSETMRYWHNVAFVSIGVNYAEAMEDRHPGRTISVPWSTIENYPYSLTNIDIAIAPSHDSKYFKSKSSLRWIEASAAGIPVLANPITYHEIEDGKTGLLAETPAQAEEKLDKLVSDEILREKLAAEAKETVRERFDIAVTSQIWRKTLEQIANT